MRLRYLVFALSLAAPSLATAGVTVTHSDPAKFTDIEDKNSEPERTMREFKTHLEYLGERYTPGKNVNIEVFDIDRAGRPRLRHDIRVMTGRSDFPCIDLASALDGGTMKRERVCDMDYLRSLPPPYNAGEALVFEKRMLDDWYRRRAKDAGWDK
jgi:hypothetical protein